MKPRFRRPSRTTQPPTQQLSFDFMRTTPLQLTPDAQRKAYGEYWRSIRGEPRHYNPKHRRPDNGTR
jgi:hypothetical protein